MVSFVGDFSLLLLLLFPFRFPILIGMIFINSKSEMELYEYRTPI